MERVSIKITKKISSIERLQPFSSIPVSKVEFYREIINAQLFNRIIFDVISNVRIKIDLSYEKHWARNKR